MDEQKNTAQLLEQLGCKSEIFIKHFIASGLTEDEAKKLLKDKAFLGTFRLVLIDAVNKLIDQTE